VIDNILEDMKDRSEALPKYSDTFLVIPLDDASQGFAVFKCQLADIINALLQPRLLDAASVREDGRSLLSQIHVQAGVPAQQLTASSAKPAKGQTSRSQHQ